MRFWAPYVPVAQRRARARRKMEQLRKRGRDIQPVEIEGRAIARSFWGKGWCDHLESFSDFENRLPRGRTYVRNGSVCHLAIHPGQVEAIVSGSELYNVSIRIKKLKPAAWRSVKERCSGRIGSILELLRGKLSDHVMAVVTDRARGLFPQPREIELHCSCPDWAVMCKHVAAVLYGVGNRLDSRPELLFLLRDVDAQELISTDMTVPGPAETGDVIDSSRLSDIFGIDLDGAEEELPAHAAAGNQRSNETPANTAPGIRPTGKSVARLRKRLGLSVAQFARQLNVSAASVYRWEAMTGRLKLRPQTLAALPKSQRSR